MPRHVLHRRLLPLLACAPLALLGACAANDHRVDNASSRLNDPALREDPRMEWWRDARFGMFIHWGLYAIPAGEWNGVNTYGEWIRTTAQIPLETYDTFASQFNPVDFDADAIVLAAKNAGMKYIVITTKHHDGFALFDSNVSDFDVMATPFKRDIMKEMADACRKHGLMICWYHSIMDWHHPDYLPRRTWETDRPTAGADYDRFNAYLNAQVTELLTNYGPIGVMWFDGEWESTWTHERGVALYNLCRKLQPDVIINNRVDVHRGGMAGFSQASDAVGDFGTPEQEVPAQGLPGVDWETCMTIHTHWGHNKADTNPKSGQMLVRTLIDVASKGGNFLLNIGPMANGRIEPSEADRLAHIGRWMEVNGEAIRGTGASILPSTPWGRCTIKRDGKRTTLYLHVFDWPTDGRLFVDGIGSAPRDAQILGRRSSTLRASLASGGLDITLPSSSTLTPDPDATVIKLVFDGEPVIYHPVTINADSENFVASTTITLTSPTLNTAPGATIRYTLDGSAPSATSPVPSGPITLAESATISAAVFVGDRRVSDLATRSLTRVEPWGATVFVRAPDPGLKVQTFSGDFQRCADFLSLAPESETISPIVALPTENPPRERVARRYTGVISIPSTGMHHFALTSDDGSRLLIDDNLVIDNDGLHAAHEVRAAAPLEAGYHRITIDWFNRTGGAALSLKWRGPDGSWQPVPADMLAH
ncbi:MAG: alpha-L-fucosidase [Phycisphaeraceae bacterium]|nr:alpha-L-fucosidase [Phycisphaeraceae bacterium]